MHNTSANYVIRHLDHETLLAVIPGLTLQVPWAVVAAHAAGANPEVT
jgi:hypothetical protein